MTTAKLKDYYLALWLKPETAETRTARFMWGIGAALASGVVFMGALFVPVTLVQAFSGQADLVRFPVVFVSLFLALCVLWLVTRPLKWQEEREFEHTADMSDGQVVTLNIKTANGVDYADRQFGGFLKGCLSAALRDWEGHLKADE